MKSTYGLKSSWVFILYKTLKALFSYDKSEVYHSSYSKEEMNYYLEIANKYGLLINGGSDFHGKTVKPDIELGTGKDNNIRIKKLSLLDKLHK